MSSVGLGASRLIDAALMMEPTVLHLRTSHSSPETRSIEYKMRLNGALWSEQPWRSRSAFTQANPRAEIAKPFRGGKRCSCKCGMIACNLLPHFHIPSSSKQSVHQETSSRLPFDLMRVEQNEAVRSLKKKTTNNRISLPKAMEARAVNEIPRGRQWQYEPKWDGFRCLLGRSQNAVAMRSKSGQDLARYFPEIDAAAVMLPERDYILDGEIVVPTARGSSFDDLLQRIHPAESRIQRLAVETPALFIAFDLLMRNGTDLAGRPLSDRRRALESFAKKCFAKNPNFRLSPSTTKLTKARRWLTARGGTDGVIAKRLDLPYQEGTREGMQKIKLHRTADCVIGGFRYGERPRSGKRLVGSVLLGLYDSEGLLHHVGFSSGIRAAEKTELTDKLEAIRAERSFTGNAPGAPSRWSTKRSSEWIPVRPKFVVEVSYDHFSQGRFRHGTTIVRWRPDKKPAQCTMEQLGTKVRAVRLKGAP